MKKLLVGMLLAAAAASAAGCRDQNAAAATAPAPPPNVSVVTVTPERVAVTGEWIATLDGTVNAQIRPQVSGYLLRRVYREGAFVRKGEVLFEIDRRPLEAALSQATARLAEAKAQLAKSERDLARDRPLAEQRAIAQSQLDNDLSARDAAQAAQASAQAAVESAELNLALHPRDVAHRRHRSDRQRPDRRPGRPDDAADDGVAGRSDQGLLPDRASRNTSASPMRCARPRPLSRLWQDGGGLALVLADGSVYARRGTVVAVDRDVDPKMGTIRLSATFPNPGNVLRPGQFGRVRAQTGVADQALLVPQRAVTELQSGHQVRVVKADGTIDVRAVTMGRRVGAALDRRRPACRPASASSSTRRRCGRHAVKPKPSSARGGAVSVALLHRPADRRDRHRHRHRARRRCVALGGLPIAQFPQIVPPQIDVTAQYPGADALTIEQSVATPLEQQMNGVDDMLYMQSTNANDGTMTLTVDVRRRHGAEPRSGQRAEPAWRRRSRTCRPR